MGEHINKLWAEYTEKRDKPILTEYQQVKESIEKSKTTNSSYEEIMKEGNK